ncbi:MAG: TonB-dependent receptor [Gemmatimonadetes bacterium]|nr:TonB-dependent receptor [Gemmatimonadota bacterium]
MRNRSAVIGAGMSRDGWSGGLAWRRYGFEYGLPYRELPADGIRLRGARDELLARVAVPRLGPFTQLRVEGGHQRYAHDEVATTGDVATTLGLVTSQVQMIGAMRPWGASTGGALGLTWSSRENGVTGDQALTPPSRVDQGGAVVFQELRVAEKWRLPVALRLERTNIRSLPSARFGDAVSRRFDAVSASGGAVFSLSKHGSLAVSAAHAVRAPSVEELFSRAGHAGTGAYEIGNAALSPEVTRGVDLVWRVERPALRAQVAGYHSAVRGWIGMYPSGRDTAVVVGDVEKLLPLLVVSQRPARLTGVEFEVERVVREHLVAGLVGDVMRARDHQGGALPFMPAGRLGGHARYDNGRIQLGASVRRQARQGEVPDGEYQAPGFTQVDGFVGVTWFAGPAMHGVMLRVDNAGNRLTRDATSRAKDYAPNAGRNLALTYRLSF